MNKLLVRLLASPGKCHFPLRLWILFTAAFWTCGQLLAADIACRILSPENNRVPRTLLNIVHSIEGQREMGIPQEAQGAFDTFLRKPDAEWMKVRVRPEMEQLPVIAKAERLVVEEVALRFGQKSLARLHQLELQAQGSRAFLRPEVVDYLNLTPFQTNRLHALFEQTERAALVAREAFKQSSPDQRLATNQHARLRANETKATRLILTPEQRARYRKALGPTRNTKRFDRIYAQAPELIDSGAWLEDRPIRLSDLRGKVVLLHFYAFQCHNCQANYGIYNNWERRLKEKGVEIIGIQTPETPAEAVPAKVRADAHRQGFKFPVLIDLARKNWEAWGNTIWPTVYVIDKRGYIRYWWLGELNWQGARGDRHIERLVDKLRLE
ncbi:redoxin domain-containing protein [bacterium]|nr:redoxin domain-containing protein [bacterium]MDG1891458.1 redoxin domain-containing protein [Verrucomicrobiota bacterium]